MYILNKAFLLILIIASSQHIFTLFSNSQDLVLCICIKYGICIYNIWSDLHFSSSEHYLASFHQSFRHKMSYSWYLIFLIFLLQFIFFFLLLSVHRLDIVIFVFIHQGLNVQRPQCYFSVCDNDQPAMTRFKTF